MHQPVAAGLRTIREESDVGHVARLKRQRDVEHHATWQPGLQDEHTERELRVLAGRRRVEARLQQRALVILLAAQGCQRAQEVQTDERIDSAADRPA